MKKASRSIWMPRVSQQSSPRRSDRSKTTASSQAGSLNRDSYTFESAHGAGKARLVGQIAAQTDGILIWSGTPDS